jgi:DNA-binding SARP family transcriptional activator
LGPFELERGDRLLRAQDWPRKKAAALLKRLALERRLLKDQAIEFLWPDASFASTANNLYNAIHTLRQTLDAALGQSASGAIFSFEDGVLSLASSVWVDVQEFERLCAPPPSASPEQRTANLTQALDLYRGDLLPDDRYEEWTLLPRQALQRRQREARLELAALRREARDYASAIALLNPLLSYDLADEPIHRELMRLYTLAGQRHEALRQYQTCVDELAEEIDALPSPETTALYAQILSGELSPPPAPLHAPWSPPAPIVLEMQRSAPLVGRAAELEKLRSWLHGDRRAQGRTILIAGDSGVGKTRLAYEALGAASTAGMITLLGAAYEQEGQLAYQPFVEAFDRYLADHRRPPSENPISGFKPRGSGDPQQEQWALFNAAAAFLNGLAATLPVALLVDDLHAADEASLHLFHYLARHTRATPVVLLATCRSDIGDATATPYGTLMNALYRERLSETLTLAPLSESAAAGILAHTLGGEAAPELVKAVFEITEGNPFFIEEITRALLKSGQVEDHAGESRLRPGAELRISADLAGLLRERTRHLGQSVEEALTAAAVIGREFRFDVLRGIVGAQGGAQGLAPLLDALDAALAGNLLEETAEGYRFRHPLTRHALYAGLSRARRAHLHGQTAAAIEALYARQSVRAFDGTSVVGAQGLAPPLDPYVEDLAFHYDLSDRRDRALGYLLRAGEKAAGVYAFEVAAGYFERALDLMNALGLADPASRWMILESLGWWGTILADTPRGVARFEQALALPHGEGWQPARSDRARLHRGAAVALITVGDTAAAEAHLRAALAEIDERADAADYAQVLYNVAQLHWHRNEFQEAFEVAQRSLAIAERVNDPAAIARAFEMLALACHSLGEWQNGIEYEQQRIALSGPGLDVTEAFDVHL